jgi:hypothetical protein
MSSTSKWKRRLLWAGAFVGLCVVYLWFLGTQTFFALYARQIGRKNPIVKSVPVELKDMSVSDVKGERLSFKEAEFEVPWNDVDEEKTRITGNWALFHFRSGNSIILCVTPPDGFIADMAKSKTPDPELFKEIYGPEVLRSDYALHKAIFETTPSQITLLTPANRAAGLSSVIFIKAIMPPTTDWAIYNIRSQNFRGFQLGDPVRRPKKMCLELYGSDVHFEINIEQNTSLPGRSITQAEINRIIQTARKAPYVQSKISVNPT